MTLTVTALYAVALTIVLLALTYHVIFERANSEISILHGDNMALATKIRRHGNFVEFVPMALILLALAELSGAGTTGLHVAGVLLLVARIVQPFGMDAKIATKPARIIGGTGTQLSMVVSCGLILWAQFM